MADFNDYYWRLFSVSPHTIYDVELPKDLQWMDEFTWKPISKQVTNTLSGGIVVQEYKKETGRSITLIGQDDMSWIQRPLVKSIHAMTQEEGFVMTLEFTNGTLVEDTHEVMFDHAETPFEVESVKNYDNFEDSSWFKISGIRFIEVVEDDILNPCGT